MQAALAANLILGPFPFGFFDVFILQHVSLDLEGLCSTGEESL